VTGIGRESAAASVDDVVLATSAGVDDALHEQLVAGLGAALPQEVQGFDRTPLAITLRTSSGRLIGGLSGHTLWGWLSIEMLWVDPAARGAGHGRRLIAAAEQEALRRGCHHARVDTYSFQAPWFYERCGYRRVATLEDFPRRHQRHFYAKALP